MVSMALILFLLLLLLIYNGNCFYKDNLRHCSCCHRYLDKQNKTYQRLHENRVIWIFLWNGAIYSMQFTIILILYILCGHLCFVILNLIQNNSYLSEHNREYLDDLCLKRNSYFKSKNSIHWPVSLRIMTIKLIQIYLLFIGIKICIHACVWCYFQWQSPVTLSK